MFRDIFTNRLFIGALVFFVLCVAGSLLYMHHENQKGAEYAAETQDRVKQWNAKQKEQSPVEAPVGDTSQGGHLHADGTWHAERHIEQTVGKTTTLQNKQANFAQENEQEMQTDFVTIPVPADPVKALLEQTKRRGHWSAGRLPPFPPEDTEAAELAACVYLITEYGMRKDYDNPNLYNAWERFNELIRPISALTEQRHISPRTHDLLRFRWPLISEPNPYGYEDWRSNFNIR